MAFKMKAGKEGPMKKNFGSMISSPMDKELVGDQHKLPEHLKKKIEAAPESPNKKKKDREMRLDATQGSRREQKRVKKHVEAGKKQGHDSKTIEERYNKRMDYQRKGPKLQAKKTTKLAVNREYPMDYRTKKQKKEDFKTFKRDQKQSRRELLKEEKRNK